MILARRNLEAICCAELAHTTVTIRFCVAVCNLNEALTIFVVDYFNFNLPESKNPVNRIFTPVTRRYPLIIVICIVELDGMGELCSDGPVPIRLCWLCSRTLASLLVTDFKLLFFSFVRHGGLGVQ